MSRQPRVTVVVLTYRRPLLLAMLLPQLQRQTDDIVTDYPGSKVMVVDNDPEGSARAVCEDMDIAYVNEATPGIAAARQRALLEAGNGLLVFIDDDETPAPDWLSLMVDTWEEQDHPAGVAGKVEPQFVSPPDEWVEAGRFFVRRNLATGTHVQAAGAGNLLLDLEQIQRLGLAFDASLGMRGGEDTLFTRQLTHRGGRLVWCQEAVAFDLVPDDRARREWVLQRSYSHGCTAAMVAIRLAPTPARRALTRLRLLVGGLARIPVGLAKQVCGRLTHNDYDEARGPWLRARGRGLAAGALGYSYAEYERRTT